MDDSVPHLRGMQWCRCTRSVLKLCAHDLWYQTFCPAHSGLRWCRCARSVLQKVNQTTKRAWNVRVVWRNRFFIFGLCFFREWFVSFKNRSLPCSRCQTGTRCGLVAAPNLHPPKISPKCSEKKWMKRLWLKIVHVVSCQMVENVEIGWHATLLTNGWSMDTVKMSVLDKSLKCWNYPKKNTFSHSSALANLPPTNASEKLLQIAGDLQIRQIVENVIKWVGMRNWWQMVEKWTCLKSWNWLTCEIVDKSWKCENDTRNVLSLQPRTKSWPGHKFNVFPFSDSRKTRTLQRPSKLFMSATARPWRWSCMIFTSEISGSPCKNLLPSFPHWWTVTHC